jgi:hypothetical protein
LPEMVLAQGQHPGCYNYPPGSCPAPPPLTATPVISEVPSYDGTYQVSITNTDTYSWTEWYTGQTGNTIAITSAQATGAYVYKAKRCINTGSGTKCSSTWSPSATAYVIRTPANPTIDATTSGVCGTLDAIWVPGSTNYPTLTHTKLYDVQQSTDGTNWTNAVMGTSTTSWGPSPVHNTTYHFRVRAWYTWSGYTSAQTGWITDSVNYQCLPSAPNAPVLSEPSIANSQISVDWSEPAAGLRYELERHDITTNPSAAWTEIYDGTNSGHTDTTATTVGNTYQYRVHACDSVPNCSGWSNLANIVLYQNVILEFQYDALGRLRKVVQDEIPE